MENRQAVLEIKQSDKHTRLSVKFPLRTAQRGSTRLTHHTPAAVPVGLPSSVSALHYGLKVSPN